jgi:hypothetical protein
MLYAYVSELFFYFMEIFHEKCKSKKSYSNTEGCEIKESFSTAEWCCQYGVLPARRLL